MDLLLKRSIRIAKLPFHNIYLLTFLLTYLLTYLLTCDSKRKRVFGMFNVNNKRRVIIKVAYFGEASGHRRSNFFFFTSNKL